MNGKITPIEVNPRFGGFCTTADLLGVTLGFNEYKCFYDKNQTGILYLKERE
jgi:hypothetical protein